MQSHPHRSSTRGSALLVVIVFVSLVAGLGSALLGLDMQTGRNRKGAANEQRAFYAAEAALNEALAALASGAVEPAIGAPVEVGSQGSPRILGSSRHWATITRLDLRRFSIIGVGRDGGSLTRHELVASYAPNGLFQYAAFGGDGVQLSSDAFVDSYDSMFGPYAGQVEAGNDWARDNAVVGSNGDIELLSDTHVYGDCHPGPGGVVVATAPGVLISGSTDPASMLVALDPITPPAATSLGAITWASDSTVGPGIVRYSDVIVNGGATLTIQGPAQLVVDNFLLQTGTSLVFDATNGPIELYSARDFVLEDDTQVITQCSSAVDVKLFLSGDNRVGDPSLQDNISLAASSTFVGAIYAPNAEIGLRSNFELFGSVMAGLLDLASNARVHFDEALLYDENSAGRQFVTLLWRRVQRAAS